MDGIDFQRSSVTWLGATGESYGRFALESLCFLRHEPTASTAFYCLGAQVLAGHVYGTDGLVMKPAYLFQIAASQDNHAMFRTYLRHRSASDSSGRNADKFKEMNLRVVKQCNVVLHDFAAIDQHFDKNSRFSARITLPQKDATVVEVEFPVKHINMQKARRLFQIETGPILFPTRIRSGWHSDGSMPDFNPAFIHFNCFDWIEVTLNVPTRAGLRSTRFYSETIRLAADVSLMASE